ALIKTSADLVYVVCIGVLLAHVENISAELLLDREVRQLEQQRQEVDRIKSEMEDFWGNVQQLMDLWLYRTIPRLDLMKEVHHHLEDCPPAAWLANLRHVNRSLENLETAAGHIEDWQHASRDAGQQEELRSAEKLFAGRVNSIIRVANTRQSLGTLVSLLNDSIGRVVCLKVTVRGARDLPCRTGLRCECEVAGKPEAVVQTQPHEALTTAPAWFFSADLPGYSAGDSVSFRVMQPVLQPDDPPCVGKAILSNACFRGRTYDGELPLSEVPKGMAAYLQVCVSEAVQVEVSIEAAEGLRLPATSLACGTYCTCALRGAPESRLQTGSIDGTPSPQWSFCGRSGFAVEGDVLEFEVRAASAAAGDARRAQADTVLGRAALRLCLDHLSGDRPAESLPLVADWPEEPAPTLRVRVAPAEGLRALGRPGARGGAGAAARALRAEAEAPRGSAFRAVEMQLLGAAPREAPH
ncbi:unnamed protein product, partial [Prorocentrum cordatum]